MQGTKYNEKQRIMILEDDGDLAEGISLSLNSVDLEFVLCKTIAEAKDMLQRQSFDLLILISICRMEADWSFAEKSGNPVGYR